MRLHKHSVLLKMLEQGLQIHTSLNLSILLCLFTERKSSQYYSKAFDALVSTLSNNQIYISASCGHYINSKKEDIDGDSIPNKRSKLPEFRYRHRHSNNVTFISQLEKINFVSVTNCTVTYHCIMNTVRMAERKSQIKNPTLFLTQETLNGQGDTNTL